ncbi:flavin reductase family protein [Marinomonas balearica]|uniref:Flavin reductase (DIM6/NTAB) family NADH-FMN oxidoreductase RutF n=1 Tax=Marinomonas balearica TaxID=491947 RepID=A0A4R6MBR8_9GAMM|nr:flavin reductase family protein [Marinomonas balearica]TDO98756.1 flavin reductase (DIM6/NTAB) family NADH-FMN oxidoreductase RutF [Marinomonas balearica]
MDFHFNELNSNQCYHLMTQTITPRPIAWILTENEDRSFNLAPFSYFAALNSDPALMVVSIGNKSQGTPKDTKKNLLRTKECVLHIPSLEHANAVNESAATLNYNETELTRSGVSIAPFVKSLPRIKEAKVAMHCKLYELHPFGEAGFEACYLEIQTLYIDDEIVSTEGQRTTVDADQLNPLGRLGASDYAKFGGALTLKRPQ